MPLTQEQLGILQHSLGLDKYGQGEMYRNHFCAGGRDETVCRELVELGYMSVFAPNRSPLPYYNCTVTEAGKQAVREQSPKPPKLTRGQKRYREFLRADTGYSFGEWLRLRNSKRSHVPNVDYAQDLNALSSAVSPSPSQPAHGTER